MRPGRERKLKIFSADRSPSAQKRRPGEVASEPSDSIVIAARDGALSLGEVQLEGKRRMSVSEFLRGHPGSLQIARMWEGP